MSDRQWTTAEPASVAWQESQQKLPRLIQQLLWQRNLRDEKSIEEFLHPTYPHHLGDPMMYRQMSVVTERLVQAITAGQQITVYGDYDADGVTATAIMVETLNALHARVNWYLPERLAEGYGLNVTAIERLAAAGTQVLITVDCGTTNVEEITRAKHLGLDVLILDHHHQPDVLPPAVAILNPAFADETYPYREQSSAGVAFTAARGLLQASDHGRRVGVTLDDDWERRLLDLVAISTVADMMTLRGENRLFVVEGLRELRQARRPGIRALLGVMGQEPQRVDEYTIGFQIAPRLNAAGRLHHASLALELLMTTDTETAHRLAAELHHVNGDRQKLTELAVSEALEQITAQGQQSTYVAFAPHWSPGIIGLVAGRLVERVWRPVLVMTENNGSIVGSGRSIPGFDIMAAMDAGREHFARFGGHPGACGFTLASVDGLVTFQSWWQGHIDKVLLETPAKPLHIDTVLSLADVTAETLTLIEQLAPYGIGNPRPKFLVDNVQVLSRDTVGGQGQHLRLVGRQGDRQAKFIGFRFGADAAELLPGQNIDLVVEASWNVWNGRREPQLKMIDWRWHQ